MASNLSSALCGAARAAFPVEADADEADADEEEEEEEEEEETLGIPVADRPRVLEWTAVDEPNGGLERVVVEDEEEEEEREEEEDDEEEADEGVDRGAVVEAARRDDEARTDKAATLVAEAEAARDPDRGRGGAAADGGLPVVDAEGFGTVGARCDCVDGLVVLIVALACTCLMTSDPSADVPVIDEDGPCC